MKTQKDNSFDVKEILAIVVRHKWLLIIPVILATAVAYAGSYWLTPKYQSSTIIWIDKPEAASRELMSITGQPSYVRESSEDTRRKLQALQNEITSEIYLTQLIRDLKLDDNPELTRSATELRELNPEFTVEQLKINILLGKLKNVIELSYVGKDQILLTVESTDPIMARDMATQLTIIMESEKTKYELEKILDNQHFADLQLKKKEYDYQQAIDSLTKSQAKIASLRLPDEISSESNRRQIQADIDNITEDINQYTTQFNRVKNQLKAVDLDKARLNYSDHMIERRSGIDNQVSEYGKMMEKYPWNSQDVVNANIRINDNIRQLEDEIAALIEQQFASLNANQKELVNNYFIGKENLDILNSRKSQLEKSYSNFVSRINQIPRMEAEISDLQGRVEDARTLRDAFKSEESTVKILSELAKERTKYKVIEAARIPLEPFWPDKNKIAVLGFILGFVIGGVAILLRVILDDSFRKTEDIEEALGLPVLAVIPKIEKLKFR